MDSETEVCGTSAIKLKCEISVERLSRPRDNSNHPYNGIIVSKNQAIHFAVAHERCHYSLRRGHRPYFRHLDHSSFIHAHKKTNGEQGNRIDKHDSTNTGLPGDPYPEHRPSPGLPRVCHLVHSLSLHVSAKAHPRQRSCEKDPPL